MAQKKVWNCALISVKVRAMTRPLWPGFGHSLLRVETVKLGTQFRCVCSVPLPGTLGLEEPPVNMLVKTSGRE